MKKIFIPLAGLILLSLVGCNWQLPQKVSVKTQAEYEFSLGNALFSAIDTDAIFEEFDLKSTVMEGISFQNSQVYDYYPDEKDATLQQFLIKIPVQEIPVNFSDYMSNSDFSSAMSDMSMDDTVLEIPDVSADPFTTSVSDVTALHSALGAMLTASGSVSSGSATALAYNTSSYGTFESIAISSAYYLVTGSFTDGTSVVIRDEDGNSVSGYFSSGAANISIAGLTFTSDTTITISEAGSYSAVVNPSYTVSVSLANGVTTVNPIGLEVTPVTFDLIDSDSASTFRSAVIGSGSMEVTCIYNSSWSGITPTYTIEMSGSLNIPETETTGTIDLADKEISGTDETSLSSEVYFALNNATLNFTSDYAISIKAATTVSSFKTITVQFGDSDSLEKSSTAALPDEFLETVKAIYLLDCGISGTYVNTLPEGNDITITINSDFLGLDSKSATLSGATESDTYSIMSGNTSSSVLRTIGSDDGEYDSIDYDVSISLPGATAANPDQVTLSNVTPNSSYTISIGIESTIDYEKLVIDTSDYSSSGSQDLGLNLSSMFSSLSFGNVNLGDSLKLSKLPIYLVAVRPSVSDDSGTDLFENAKFTGSISLSMSKDGVVQQDSDGNNIELALLDNDELNFTDSPSLNADSNNLVTTNFYNLMKTAITNEAVIYKDLTEIINEDVDSEATLCMDYDIAFSNGEGSSSELTIYKSQLSEDSSSSIAVVAYLELPLKFTISDDLSLDFGDSEEETEESEEEATVEEESDSDALDALLDIVRDASITLTPSKLPFYTSPGMTLEVGLTSDIEKSFSLSVDTESKITITNSEFESLMSAMSGGSMSPSIALKLSEGTLSIPREMGFDASVVLGLNTDGEIEVYPSFLGGE
ncbi:MAG: hypothetical protein K5681_02120 [Treponema sp.]|nr:hypothetical protein [Treponema sp.]